MELISIDVGLIFWTLSSLLTLLALVHVLTNRGIGLRLTIAWALFLFIPVLGPVLYFTVNTRRSKIN